MVPATFSPSRFLPAKMIGPVLAARIEKSHTPASQRIDRRTARFLSQRTGYASQRQVSFCSSAAGAARHDMIDVERGFLADLRQSAVFATLAGALQYQAAQPLRHVLHVRCVPLAAARSARRRSSDRVSARFTSPSASSRSSAVNNFPRSCRSSKSASRLSTPAGSRKPAKSSGSSSSIAMDWLKRVFPADRVETHIFSRLYHDAGSFGNASDCTGTLVRAPPRARK